jgi:hypothetical protein
MGMKLRKENILLNVLLGTGVYLLDSVRNRLAENLDDVTEKARDTYETAANRVSRASDVIRGEDSHVFSTTAAVLIGVGIGVGVGILLAPASGEQTRSNIADKVQEFGGKVRSRVSSEPTGATGTYGE